MFSFCCRKTSREKWPTLYILQIQCFEASLVNCHRNVQNDLDAKEDILENVNTQVSTVHLWMRLNDKFSSSIFLRRVAVYGGEMGIVGVGVATLNATNII